MSLSVERCLLEWYLQKIYMQKIHANVSYLFII